MWNTQQLKKKRRKWMAEKTQVGETSATLRVRHKADHPCMLKREKSLVAPQALPPCFSQQWFHRHATWGVSMEYRAWHMGGQYSRAHRTSTTSAFLFNSASPPPSLHPPRGGKVPCWLAGNLRCPSTTAVLAADPRKKKKQCRTEGKDKRWPIKHLSTTTSSLPYFFFFAHDFSSLA